MSHHIYHTRGLILSSIAVGESNRFYKIFTEELGLVGATAQSVREGKSKLRYTLQDFSLISVDLVRGKEVWRVVSAGMYRPDSATKENLVCIKLFAGFCAFLSRLLHGEGCDQELFDEIVKVADFLGTHILEKEATLAFETLSTLRVLVHLGYVNPEGYEKFMDSSAYSMSSLIEFEKIRLGVLPKISEALNTSHL